MRTIRPRWIAWPFKVMYVLAKIPVELLLGVHIELSSDIGPGLYIGHFGGIFIGTDAGRNLSVAQGVTIGFKGAGKSDRWPQMGNDVYVGAGAKVIGNITIGDGVIIGANTVVTKDVPSNMMIVGAKVRMSPIQKPAVLSRVGDDSLAVDPPPEDEAQLTISASRSMQ